MNYKIENFTNENAAVKDKQKKKLRIIELAKECPSDVFVLVQRFFEDEKANHSCKVLQAKLDYHYGGGKYGTVYLAINKNLLPVLKLYLFISCMDINVIMPNFRETPLTAAITLNRKSIVEFLMEEGVDYTTENTIGDTPLQCALTLGRTEIARLILLKKYDVTLSNSTEVVKFLLYKREEYYNRKQYFSTLLYYASRLNKEIFSMVLANSPVEDLYGLHARKDNIMINLLVNWGNRGILKAAIDHGVDLNISSDPGAEPLYNAILNRPKMIPFLVKNGANLHSNNCKTLSSGRVDVFNILGRKKYSKAVRIFERCGIEIYKKLSSDENKFHHLCRYDFDIKPFLVAVERGTDINHLNEKNYTPLKFAMEDDLLGRHNRNLPIEFLVSIIAIRIENKQFINEVNRKCLEDESVRPFYEKCKQELCFLRKKKITQSVYFYNFLTANLQKLTSLARNKNMMKQFRLEMKKEHEFPIYYNHLKRSLERSNWRNKEIEKIRKIVGNINLPVLILDKICGYLNDEQLKFSQYYFKILAEFPPS